MGVRLYNLAKEKKHRRKEGDVCTFMLVHIEKVRLVVTELSLE